MQHSPLNNITRILLGVIIGGAVMLGVAYAIDSKMDGWTSTVAVKNITIHDDSCRQLSGAAGYFVPTRTAAEWNAFNAVAASKGLTVAACVSYIYNWRTGWFGGIEDIGHGHPTWVPNLGFWCSREIVGNTWNVGNVGVADSFCPSPKPTERCTWTAYPNYDVILENECH